MASRTASLRRSPPSAVLTLVAIIIIGIGAGLLIGDQALPAYLAAYLFWLGLSVGSLAVLMIHHLTGGEWGNAVREPLLQATRLLPLLVLLALPLLLFPQYLYPWVHAAGNESAAHSAWYLNRPFFIGRAIAYLLLWLGLAWVLNTWGWPQSPRRNEAWARCFSAVGLVVLLITVSLAAFDWIMSLDPKWYSAAFGLLVAMSHATTALAFAVFWIAVSAGRADVPISAQCLHDLGNLLLAFVMLWAYLAFMQLLTVWIANLPHEIRWYLPRLNTSWKWLGFGIITFHLILPMPVLLLRAATHTAWGLALAAALVFVAQFLYALWLVFPTVRRDGFDFGWADVAIFLSVTGLWLGALLWRRQQTDRAARPPRTAAEA